MSAARRISRGDTAFFKFFVTGTFLMMTAIWAVLIGRLPALRDRWVHDRTTVVALAIVGSLMIAVMTINTIRSCAWLKWVALGEGALHVSNFRREIIVPLSDIDSVDEFTRDALRRVVVTFAHDTAFGRRIQFVPAGRSESNPHPIIAELRTAAAGAQRA